MELLILLKVVRMIYKWINKDHKIARVMFTDMPIFWPLNPNIVPSQVTQLAAFLSPVLSQGQFPDNILLEWL